MERVKQFIVWHFEKILVGIILILAFIGMYYVEEKTVVLNLFYLPALIASYFLGRRLGVLSAFLSILAVMVCALLYPQRFSPDLGSVRGFAILSSWGGCLILASFAVGTLYERNERRLRDLKNAYVGILEILSKYLESTDPYTKGHSVRVSEYASDTAVAMNLPRAEVETIRVAGLLHDIGKIEISGDVLRKAAALTTEERELVDMHPVGGARILSAVGEVLREVVPIVVAHHEYFVETLDGKDNGDTGKIPLGARIVAVADSFDAMTSDRPYRKGMPPWDALQVLVAKAGGQFDPEVVEAFKGVVAQKMEIV